MKTTLIAILIVLLASCSKEKEKPNNIISTGQGSLDDAGLIENFELWEPPSDAVFINPENQDDALADGSIEHPYSSFDGIQWTDNTVYALKRGTTLESQQIVISANGVTLASYGEGSRPVIWCTDNTNSGNRHGIICYWEGIDNTTIRDLEVTAPDASSCIRFLRNATNISIINCKVHDSYWGIRSLQNDGLFIYNTEVYNTNDDGMFIEDNNNIEIKNCYVHHVNTNWQPPATPESEAAGDGIQFNRCNHWWVHHNYIDRTSSGNKFCFISNNANQNNGIVEFNVMEGPTVDGASIYLHDGNNIIVRNNVMLAPAGSPVYTHSTNIQIYGNIFIKAGGPVLASSDADIYNNVFYRSSLCIQGGNIEATNNVFDSEAGQNLFHVNNLTGSNNLFVTGNPEEGSFSGDPMFVDPENGDFHLLEGSACIDQGIDMGLEQDLEGNPIPSGGGPDIGVYEYVQ